MNKMLDCNNLSGGEKQKISFIRAIIKSPNVLILDEPTSSIDKTGKQKMLEYLKKIKDSSIIIIISHDNEVLSNCDMIVTL